MKITESDRKRLDKIKRGIPYGATRADLAWLVAFAEKLLKENESLVFGLPSLAKDRRNESLVFGLPSLAKDRRPKTKS